MSITGILLLGSVVLTTSAIAQTPSAPSTITRTVIAATKLPTVTDAPLHFRVVAVTIPHGEKSNASLGNSILYQLSGSTEILVDAESRMLRAAEGMFIAAARPTVLTCRKQRTIELYPVLSCPDGGSGSARCFGSRRSKGIISHSSSNSRPEGRWLRSSI
jgi:hypothetical protein